MSELEQLVARLFCCGFDGHEVPGDFSALIDRGIGGAVLFGRNVESAAQLARLCDDLKKRAGRPFIISIDQEGGRVRRLRDGFTEIPPMRAVGQVGDVELARQLGRVLARELRAVNIDWDLAPALDVDTNPANPVIADRSLGREPEVVTRLGCAIIDGLQSDGGVAACAKHFPGHGDTSQDSHYDLPILPHPIERLQRVELHPFREAVRSGVASVMTAHVVFEAIDPEYPATMSREVLRGILRDQLHFDGVIVSDSIEMKAIANNYDFEEVVIRSVNAGMDMFMVCHSLSLQQQGIEILLRAVERGDVPRDRIERSALRVERLLQQYARPPQEEPPLDLLNCREHQEVVDHIRRRVDAALLANGADPTVI